MPVAEALTHALQQQGVKGNRLSTIHALKLALEQEEKARREAAESYDFWVGYKRREAAAIIRAKQERREHPRPYPHPDDIIVDAENRTYHIIGPLNAEEAVRFEIQDIVIDMYLGQAARLEASGSAEELTCLFHIKATLLHEMLPPSYGGGNDMDIVSRRMRWRGLGRREMTRRLKELERRKADLPPINVQKWIAERQEKIRVNADALEILADLFIKLEERQSQGEAVDEASAEAIVRLVLAQHAKSD